jgi:F0F1-type ATP synthase delta subunit
MKVPLHQVASVLSKRSLDPKLNKSKFAREVAAYLLDNGRTGELDSLLREIIKDRALSGDVELTAVSAFALPQSVFAEIRSQVKKLYPNVKQIIINERRDSDLIGGMRLEFPDSQLDLTIRSQLNRFRTLTTAERTV